MENKYYVPNTSEFHIGFEFEENDGSEWIESEITLWTDLKALFDCEDKCPIPLRVKYLDKEDIESFGFKKSNKNSWAGYKDYFLDSINPEYPYFLFATIHVPVIDDMYKIMVHRYYNEDEPIDEDDNYREPTIVFVGKIKNKSELKKLLKKLEIINERI